MALTFQKLFQPTQLGTSAATIYTMPAAPVTSFLRNARLMLVNTSASAVSVTLYSVPSGGTASATNEFLPAVSVSPNAQLQVDVPELSAGDFIQGLASTGSVISVHAMDGVIYS
ncbi:hypothetical protein [Tolumonas lignilytica]|uniref:hypothetical protein n=1 Tax=Tolumonas lignilytica TaxID=1283284 RepID=UPI000464705C|nr:hypothetical protein [Tolumonas lignilytica]